MVTDRFQVSLTNSELVILEGRVPQDLDFEEPAENVLVGEPDLTLNHLSGWFRNQDLGPCLFLQILPLFPDRGQNVDSSSAIWPEDFTTGWL